MSRVSVLCEWEGFSCVGCVVSSVHLVVQVTDTLLAAGSQWGLDSGDQQFSYECRYLQLFQTLINSLADVELRARDSAKGASKGHLWYRNGVMEENLNYKEV